MNQSLRLCWIGLLVGATALQAQVTTRIKWACIGNSITAGPTGAQYAYPVRLGVRLLMDTVQNDGVGYRTLMKSGDSTYWKYGKLTQVFAFQPDIISIMLGTNDSKPINWWDSNSFVSNYEDLIDTLSAMPSHPRIFLIYPTPVFLKGTTATLPETSTVIRESIIRYSIIPRIRQVALAMGVDTIDLQTPFLNKQYLFGSDSIHPTTPGSDSIANCIFNAYVSKVTRVACIGNSITSYTGSVTTANGGSVAFNAYPNQLNMLLGRNYFVKNLGVSGCYMLKPYNNISTIMSYWSQTAEWDTLFSLKPNIVTINLGADDSRPMAWNTSRFMTDYTSMIDTISNNISPQPQIWPVQPPPAWQVNGQWPVSTPSGSTNNGINGVTIQDSVIPAILQVAGNNGLNSINLFSAFPTMAFQADGVHPNAAGQDTIAHVLFRTMNLPTSAIYSNQPDASHVSRGAVRYLNNAQQALPSEPAGTRIYSLDGKVIPLGISGGSPVLPAGVYIVQPPDAKPNSKKATPPDE